MEEEGGSNVDDVLLIYNTKEIPTPRASLRQVRDCVTIQPDRTEVRSGDSRPIEMSSGAAFSPLRSTH